MSADRCPHCGHADHAWRQDGCPECPCGAPADEAAQIIAAEREALALMVLDGWQDLDVFAADIAAAIRRGDRRRPE